MIGRPQNEIVLDTDWVSAIGMGLLFAYCVAELVWDTYKIVAGKPFALTVEPWWQYGFYLYAIWFCVRIAKEMRSTALRIALGLFALQLLLSIGIKLLGSSDVVNSVVYGHVFVGMGAELAFSVFVIQWFSAKVTHV